MYIRMRRRSKAKKGNFRINRNFFIFQGVLIGLLLFLTRGNWVKFVFLVALEITAYFTFVYCFLANNKYKKESEVKVYNKVRSSDSGIAGFSKSRGTKRKDRNNYNWEISKRSSERKVMDSSNNSQDNTNKKSEKYSTLNSINRSTKSAIGEENKKFVPYRSPFDPIRPKEEEQKVEPEKIKGTEETNISSTQETKVQLQQSKKEMGTNIHKNLEESIYEDLEGITRENSPDIQMEFYEKKEIFNIEAEYKDKLHNDGEDDENNSLKELEEVGCEANIPVNLGYQEKTEVYPKQIQKDTKARFEDEKTVTSVLRNKKTVDDYKPVQSGKMQLDIEEYGPPVELLRKNEQMTYDEKFEEYIEYNSYKLIDTLASFGVGAKVLDVSKGPTVTRYELQPNAGVKVSKIINLADDIALNLAATGVRIEAPIPGKAAVGIEIPNKKNVPVFLRDVIESEVFQKYPSKLAFAVGKDIAGNVVVGDIAKMPHLLIAGATGSGKSVCINTLIVSILYKASPAEVRLLMVDPKVVELGIYNGIPHLLIPVVTDPKKAAGALSWAVIEMTTRYRLFAENNVRDLSSYNELIKERGEGETLPHIVIIIDELADLMMVAPNEVEDSICRLAQMARAAGMHLVIATQRPSVNVITGVIKANIPSRVSFAVSSQIDSRTILDMAGAEKLLGKGDMLFYPIGQPKPLRVQGSFISDKEVDKIVTHIKSLHSAEYDEEILQKINNQNETQKVDTSGDDEILSQAIDMVLEMGQASASLIQRKFKVGYSRAARILDQMESWGVVGASDGSKPRQILITKQEWDELNT